MADKAYRYMNWAAIEGIVYSDENHPKEVMKPRTVKEGTLYQCFLPGAESVQLKELKNGKLHDMTMEDESGYFACVLSGKKAVPHTFVAEGTEFGDPYAVENQITGEEEVRFGTGIASRIYRKLGAHVREINGQKGILFAVWAPNAMRVSVVGDFNDWDGRMHPMEFHEESGIYELFIPELEAGCKYNYELKLRTGLTYTRPDPFANAFNLNHKKPVSVCADLGYHWHDREYLEQRSRQTDHLTRPTAVYECPLQKWEEKTGKHTYRELADEIASYAAEMGYTHIELLPIMEYPDAQSNGYQTGGYYAPTSRYGNPADFKYFVDSFHQKGIGVILTWTPSQFTGDVDWLASYDGTSLYEHLDPRQGIHPLWGSCLYNYGRPEVRSFLISNAEFWMREYHVDGLLLDGCSTMLRLDYKRGDNYVANIYGSNENLEGIDFLKKLSEIYHKDFPDGLLMMEEDIDWPDITANTEDGGFGYDFKWNLHFTEDMLRYLGLSSEERKAHHEDLLNGMLHHYMEHFIVSLSRGIGFFDREALLEKIDGKTQEEKEALLRCAYGYLFCHPGKKLLTAGEEFHHAYLKDLIGLYRNQPALSGFDYDENGFEWINTMDSEHSVLTFLRKTDRKEETLLVAANFSDENFPEYQVGVPFDGKYKEIFNSDTALYGGSGEVNSRARSARHETFDEREYSLRMRLAPRSIAVFQYREK